jgi:predicted esterase
VKVQSINNRGCLIIEPATAPTNVVVALHPLACLPTMMTGCMNAQAFAQYGILVVIPPSVPNPYAWATGGANSVDTDFLATLPNAIRAVYSHLQRIDILGFSDGGVEITQLTASDKLSTYDHRWMICGSWPQTPFPRVLPVPSMPDLIGTTYHLYSGASDPFCKDDGSGNLVSMIDMQTILQTAGATVMHQTFDGGHCIPGGSLLPGEAYMLGGQATIPEMSAEVASSMGLGGKP